MRFILVACLAALVVTFSTGVASAQHGGGHSSPGNYGGYGYTGGHGYSGGYGHSSYGYSGGHGYSYGQSSPGYYGGYGLGVTVGPAYLSPPVAVSPGYYTAPVYGHGIILAPRHHGHH
jgi:hypothetical protein